MSRAQSAGPNQSGPVSRVLSVGPCQSGRTDTLPNTHSAKTSISGKPITRNSPIVASMMNPQSNVICAGYTYPVLRRKMKTGRMPNPNKADL